MMRKVFKIEKADDSTGFLLWKATNLWQREIRKALKPFGLTHAQFVVLAGTYYLSLSKQNLTQVDIANHIEIDKMMTSNILRAMEKRNLIARKEHKTDTRAKVIEVTKKGEELLVLSVREVETFDEMFFQNLKSKSGFNKELLSLMNYLK